MRTTAKKILIVLASLLASCADLNPTNTVSSRSEKNKSDDGHDNTVGNLDSHSKQELTTTSEACNNVQACPAGTSLCKAEGCSCVKDGQCGKPAACPVLALGDVNKDTQLSSVDVTLLRRSLDITIVPKVVLDDCQNFVADVNQDSELSMDDVRLLRAAVTQLIKLPRNFGDINDDKNITMADAQLVSAHLGGTITLTAAQLFLADMNGDNQVTTADYDIIVTISAGK